ncbi:MAG TPA: hypothetical protein VL069_07530, partial [Opitutus sp.]|nr:hypothetical protein [Opitutus sp.]
RRGRCACPLPPAAASDRRLSSGARLPAAADHIFERDVIIATLLVLLAGCATPPREVLVTPARTVIVTGFEPFVRGVNVGTTVFQNRQWEATPEGFDANEVASRFIEKTLTQPVPVVDGRTSDLAFEKTDRFLFIDSGAVELKRRLIEFGRAQSVDRVVLLTTGVAQDWIAGTNQPLKGFGLYRREAFGMKRIQVYGVFQLQIFDCKSQKIIASDSVKGAQAVYSIEWRESWAEFTAAEQRRVTAAFSQLLTENVAQLLTRAGLANTPLPAERSMAKKLLLIPERPKSWLPDGNVLPIPKGVSPERAREAVVHGLVARGWTVASAKDDEVVGFHPDGQKEVRVTAVLTSAEVKLVPGDRETKPDGSTVSSAPHKRWHNNLKESIYRNLLDAEDAADTKNPHHDIN